MDLPKRERTFHFDYTGESGFRYDGLVTIKCRLTVAEKYNLELEKSRLLADMSNPTDSLYGLSVALSTLRAKIIDAPNWWQQKQGWGVEDEDALVQLYRKAEDECIKWKEELIKVAQENQELGK
jgi:hypothetical protein